MDSGSSWDSSSDEDVISDHDENIDKSSDYQNTEQLAAITAYNFENNTENEKEENIDIKLKTKKFKEKVVSREDKLSKFLDTIYDWCLLRPLYQNVTPSFADEVPFLVDGDSLMITIMSDKNWSNQLGGSSLHLIYLFERHLNIFVQRGGTFHIVFFENWRNIWHENWNILLFRSAIIAHFSQNVPRYPIHLFDHCFDENFANLVSTLRPGFILTNMEAYENCSSLCKIQKYLLKLVMDINLLNWLKMDLPCIDTNYLKIDVSFIQGFYLESNSTVKLIMNHHGNTFRNFITNIPKIESSTNIPDCVKVLKKYDIRKATFLTAAYLFYKKNKNESMVKIIFLTCAFMECFHLKNRGCPKFIEPPQSLNEVLAEWHKCMFFALTVCEKGNFDPSLVADIWQGILFGHVCRFVLSSSINNRDELGSDISIIYENMVQDFNKFGYSIDLYPIVFSNSNIRFENIVPLDVTQTDPEPLSLTNNSLFLSFCGDILDNIEWENPPRKLVQKSYTEEHHYHNMKAMTDEYDHIKDQMGRKPETYWAIKRYERLRDLHAKYMTLYALSIDGGPLKVSSVVRDSKASSQAKDKKEGKKAKQIKEANLKEKQELQNKKSKEQYEKLKEQSKKYDLNPNTLLNSIHSFLSNKSFCEGPYKIATLFLKLKTLRKLLINKTDLLENTKLIFLTIREILDSGCELSTKKQLILSKSLSDINCVEIAKRNNLPIQNESLENDTWIRLQLEELGPELVRETGGTPDPRARGFIPDPWQSELFNIVDKKQSALIVAPTSSGKTYASYYCMEKVLKEGTEGVVVYVAPTKALVNQVAATVYAKFKDTKMPDGMSVYGVFTRDYRMNAINSQILITIPQCLEILLLSPRRHAWVKRLRYAIFDEIHCIEGDMGGSFFERCLLLIRCPFLALSATIRNPQGLHEWLQKSENFKHSRDLKDGFPRKDLSYRVNLVIHSERHSDLTKYTYGNGRLHHLHPYAELEASVIRNHRGIPSHMNLSPAETIQLYDAMFRVFPKCQKLALLSPVEFFSTSPKNGFISRNLVQKYALELSNLLKDWFKNDRTYFDSTIRILKTGEADKMNFTGKAYIMENISDFILHLKEKNMLPAIVFAYSRILIKDMTCKVTEYFEEHKKQNNSKIIVNSKGRETKCLTKTVEDRLETKKYKMKALQSYSGNAKKNLDDISANMNYVDRKNLPNHLRNLSFDRPLNLICPNADQTLQGVGVIVSEDIAVIEQRLRKANITSNHIISRSMRNGVCMHHGGLNNKVRSAVEMLYRKKFLNVVFASGTLALGIHMPCKTTVIVGNSAYLNSLEYHQMAGRAGRRGYDTSGNVIFFGLNPRKQHSLMTAKLPLLKGNFPVTVSLILRTLLLVSDVTDKGKESEEATKISISRVLTMYENCLCYMENPDLKINIKHFFSFTLQLLQIQDFVNNRGEPLKWCGLASHLHYHEPGNLAFVYLLRTGIIREICTETDNPIDTCYQLLLILSYLFTKWPLNEASKKKFQNSKVILEPLPEKVHKALELYNEQVRFVFKQYFANVANHFKDDDNILPLSSVKISGKIVAKNNSKENLQTKLFNFCPPTRVCSSFAALSGNDDDSSYTEDTLISNLKQKMAIDVKIIPLVNLDQELNRYALDFYEHGIVQSIVNDNGIKEGAEFTLLSDFALTIKAICTSLEEMKIEDENDVVYKYFKLLDANYSANYNKAFGYVHV